MKLIKTISIISILICFGCEKQESQNKVPLEVAPVGNATLNQVISQPTFESWSKEFCLNLSIEKVKATNIPKMSDTEFNEFSIAAINCADAYYSRDEFYWLSIMISKEEIRRGNNEAKFALYLDQYCQENFAGVTAQRKTAFIELKKYAEKHSSDYDIIEQFKKIEKDFARQSNPKTCTKNDCSQSPEEKVCN